jgi:sugar lactone lactonase YvrE
MNAACICAVGAKLGEGPIWIARERAVWFVDIKGRRIHRYSEADESVRSWGAPEDVGFIVPAYRGGFICGLKSGLYRFDPASGDFDLITRVDSNRPNNRLNDAHVDAAGRLWFGTMDDDEKLPTGSLYRFDDRGLKCCDENYVITNGPATSPDGRTLYHVDTLARLIYAYDLSPDGDLEDRRVFARVAQEGAYPDGAIVDAEGRLWVGLYGGWGVNRYSAAGALIDTISLPVANCTKPLLGNDDLRTLYVTTAWKGLTEEQREQQPQAGGLLKMQVESAGQPQHEVRYDG